MIRGNLGMAMQGLAVVPLFAGYDARPASGRIFSYDVTGGRYEEHELHAVGSGSLFARGALKKLWRDGPRPPTDAVRVPIQALYDAADDDSATGGPDLTRRIFPVVAVVTPTATTGSPTTRSAAIVDAGRRRAHGRPRRPATPRCS